ncbi:receptor-type tyrosine-protein phosphatase alpha isoform X2 [Magallana gigas]|uniref:receptor-type tyrosine-protein phosphatase alpha isoform X2 n=1 Tax=Magallana gigas TaxID=29159 RepID=UPI00333F8E46
MIGIFSLCVLLHFFRGNLAFTQLVGDTTVAISSTTYSKPKAHKASRAVDGNTDQDISRCFHSDVRSDITEAWLRIDLGEVYSVKSVKFWYRRDRTATRLRGHSLRVSNDTNVPPESSCYTDPGNVTLPTIIEEDCKRTTRYVWIYQTNKSGDEGDVCPILEICEVQVLGCEVGYYGENCSRTCDHCKNNATCEVESGECDKFGCATGYIKTSPSETCERCKPDWYGEGCKLMCGHCLGSEPCHHVNGSCPRGCQDDYITDRCSTYLLNVEVYNGNTPDLTIVFLIVGPFAGLLVIVLCVLTLTCLLRQSGRKGGKQNNDICQDLIEQDPDDDESPETLDDTILYTTVQIRSKSVKTTDLPSVIKTLEKDTDKGFTEEFNSIPYGEQSDINCTVGKLLQNIPKNRFKTTFPYDHSRVVLQSSTDGDYINANYIKNTDDDVAYIASQGPKPKTVGDFWQMVWQENVFVIAMVTNLKEGKKIKCERYWPLSGNNKMLLETFTIQMLSEKAYANFAIHHLKLINRKTHEIRLITHLQYTSWPDHGTPNPLELLDFYRYVSKAMEQNSKEKLIVHCSAGIGRTGTFIALDALHRQGVKKGKINIVEYVHTMREDRMNMIQNQSQYKFLYRVLYESFRTGSHLWPRNNFVQEVGTEMQTDKAVNLSNLRREFKDLESLKKTFDETETQIGLQNSYLNMTQNVLPADNMRTILSSPATGRGSYYNAVPFSSFTTKGCIIAGQYPVQGAGIDLIRLLVDQDCSSLVLTYPLSEIPHSAEWFPKSSINYRVEISPSTKLTVDVNKQTIKIKDQSNDSWRKISMYEIKAWNENLPHVLLYTIGSVRSRDHVDQNNKLVVLSRDGASRCGEFCAVYNAIQQLQQDQEVDMFTIVRQLQSRRPEMISDVNEYLRCCQIVADYIKSEPEDTECRSTMKEENVYANT